MAEKRRCAAEGRAHLLVKVHVVAVAGEAVALEQLLVVQPLAALEVVDEREARGGVDDVLAQDRLAVLLLLNLVGKHLGAAAAAAAFRAVFQDTRREGAAGRGCGGPAA